MLRSYTYKDDSTYKINNLTERCIQKEYYYVVTNDQSNNKIVSGKDLQDDKSITFKYSNKNWQSTDKKTILDNLDNLGSILQSLKKFSDKNIIILSGDHFSSNAFYADISNISKHYTITLKSKNGITNWEKPISISGVSIDFSGFTFTNINNTQLFNITDSSVSLSNIKVIKGKSPSPPAPSDYSSIISYKTSYKTISKDPLFGPGVSGPHSPPTPAPTKPTPPPTPAPKIIPNTIL